MKGDVYRRIGKDNFSFDESRSLIFSIIIIFSAMQSEGPVEHVPVFGSTSGSVRSTSPNVQPSISQPILTVQQQTQATAFVQPTQQSHPQIEPINQELSSNIVEVVQSSPVERPSTSTAVFGTGKINFKMKSEYTYAFIRSRVYLELHILSIS